MSLNEMEDEKTAGSLADKRAKEVFELLEDDFVMMETLGSDTQTYYQNTYDRETRELKGQRIVVLMRVPKDIMSNGIAPDAL